MNFDFSYILNTLPLLFTGLKMTILISITGIIASLIIGMSGAVIRTLKIPVLSQIVVIYVDLIRNTPLLVHVFYLYFVLPALGIKLSAVAVGIIALSLWGGAFAAENFRGGTDAVPNALIESGQALGMSTWQIVRFVIIPLGFRISFPAFSNTAVSVIKNSAYMTSIGVAELTFMAVDRIAYDFKTYEMLATIAVIYLILIWVTSYLFRIIERKLDYKTNTTKGRGLNGGIIQKLKLYPRRAD
ncbi:MULTISPECIES: amino acid ABC transporter permease [unclassified Paenibacillus]|uniref:amino acid ABC transporter permease n=1 Tax=unclassified Paenibacillus TaxID=185978 RepID=UPI002406AB0D|nr:MULTISPECIES: amino acid ABC transporter permease [unclassified Paenibacillus]MDF9839493.1 His/Glu/Gln/Arg/opine family amino acid ABC transporter permease subunit [Paenibacillus sp. PastF-2]MDF9846074.1 His/Glu/Gln/Arg/opine family amino acid ABC transporter permease subunit [Paenibacillus sp. PastM-2]MDF9852647.1 His/Glu/Gln/Arg/opine family amino acid ABC transporter permease subunit [Paenibacillus sp. PastF-1]MDH6477622.1 His/Glu/Gln/Arg/opine family amino acid ABC transporter permease s